jgi:hypothetical protein
VTERLKAKRTGTSMVTCWEKQKETQKVTGKQREKQTAIMMEKNLVTLTAN